MTEYQTLKNIGVEVHYMKAGYSCLTHNDRQTIYLFTDEKGHHKVDACDVPTELVTEWLQTAATSDEQVLAEAYELMQNGIRSDSASESLGVRSMMVGDIIALQTNNRGPKRQYAVADMGFERIA